MRSFSRIVLAAALALAVLVGSGASQPLRQQAPRLGTDSLEAVIAAMALEEKASLLVGEGFIFGPPGQGGAEGEAGGPGSGSPGAPTVGNSLTIVPGAAGATAAIPRLGIPPTVLADGPAGLRIAARRKGDDASYHATAFPIATLLASSWDTDLVYRVGQAFGNEVLEYGVDILLAPALNIHRDPLGGRSFEYYSEDPLISGRMAAAMVRGVQSQGVGTSVKHFVANNQETNRNTVDTRVSRKALREIYLKGFEIAVREAAPWTVMSSYNKVNGHYASESPDLLTRVLREDWGFQGYVMTDWFGGRDAVAQMAAGNDLLMPGTPAQREQIVNAVREGRLKESVLDRNLERLLRIIEKTPRFRKYRYSNRPDLKAHAGVARAAAAEGMVLLKNDGGTLPLGSKARVALFGNASYDTLIGGTGSGDVNEAYSVSIREGLGVAGFHIDEALAESYGDYIAKAKEARPKPAFWFLPEEPILEMPIAEKEIERTAESSEAAVLALGRSSGEFGDRKVEGDFNLSEAEKELITDVCREFQSRGKRVVVVLNVGGVIETAGWKGAPDAILLAWQPGQEAGHAVADVLSGKVNPSGRLATTFPLRYEDTPSRKNFPGVELPSEGPADAGSGGPMALFQGKPSQVTYEEGVYVGYRYYTTFDVAASYDFGHGLSYTTFDHSGHELDMEGGKGVITLRVRNGGKVAGREVVQAYVGAPTPGAPKKALVAFAKTKLLQPGESRQIRLEIDPEVYASFDTAESSWVLEPGRYRLFVGASSKDVRWTGGFEVGQRTVLAKVANALAPEHKIETIRPPAKVTR